MEEEDDAIAIRRAFNETEDRLRGIRYRQNQVGNRLSTLMSRVDCLTRVIHNKVEKDIINGCNQVEL